MSRNFYVGLDVSKGYADIIILDERKRQVESGFQLDDTFEGHSKLFKILSELYERFKPDMIYAAVESTGGYENNWYGSLMKFKRSLPVKVARLNPSGVHFNSKADLKRVITDKVSARCIAEYLIAHSEKVVYDNDENFNSPRRQMTFINMLVSQKSELLNQLESLYYDCFPEIVRYCQSGVPQWALYLLKKYPTAERLAQADAKTLSKIPYINYKKAKILIDKAKHSVASSSGELMENLIKSTVEQILNLSSTIKEQKEKIIEKNRSPELDLLKSFPGISDISAIRILIEIGSMERFPDVKKLASYFGLNPAYKQSGDGASKVMMSKQGRPAIRRVLYTVVMVGLKYNPILEKLYAKHKSKGMPTKAAMGVCMHKTLRIIYGMLKNGTRFNAEVDIRNQQGNQDRKIIVGEGKNRRYQSFDKEAPVSKRQRKKRRVGSKRQNAEGIKYGVKQPTQN